MPSSDPHAFANLVDLTSPALGSDVLLRFPATSPSQPPVGKAGRTMEGAVCDAQCIVRLGVSGQICGVDIDTSHTHGSATRRGSLEGTHAPPDATLQYLREQAAWTTILPQTVLQPGRSNLATVDSQGPWTHVRLQIQPDGEDVRLRVFGRPVSEQPAPQDEQLTWLNSLSRDDARQALTRCCGATRWVEAMVEARPFESQTHLQGHARYVWWHLSADDWREAFTHHPKIGASPDHLRARFANTASWSADEQASVAAANEETITALAKGNVDYEARYGFIFIVCASGLSAREMLNRLQARMDHDTDTEVRIAAGEQAKITALRLQKLERP